MERKAIAPAVTSVSRDPALSILPFVFRVWFEMSHLQLSELIRCRERVTGTVVALESYARPTKKLILL